MLLKLLLHGQICILLIKGDKRVGQMLAQVPHRLKIIQLLLLLIHWIQTIVQRAILQASQQLSGEVAAQVLNVKKKMTEQPETKPV